MKVHVSNQRRIAAQEKIKAKIKVLERYITKGIPESALVPKDMASFRRWKDETLNLKEIGSPNTMDKPYNCGLKKRVLELIEELIKKQTRKERRTDIIEKLRARLKRRDQLVPELTSQLHITRHDLGQSQQSERRLKKRVEKLTEENAELCRILNTVTGLRSVGGSGQEE
jgi:hypothetical protein